MDLAELLQVSTHTVSQWFCGLTRPQYMERLAIAKLTGIDPHDWMTEKERASLKEKLRRIEQMQKTKPVVPTLFERMAAQL